jgi:hypothetical protein
MSRAYRLLGAGRAEMVDVPRPEPGPDEVLLRVPCSRGEDNVCRDVVPGAIGITRDGGMADHVVVPARNLVAVGAPSSTSSARRRASTSPRRSPGAAAGSSSRAAAAAGCRSPARMGAGGAPDREIAMVHTFGGTRRDLMQALALAESGRVRTHVAVHDLAAAGRVLADLDAGKVLGRAVLVPWERRVSCRLM